MLQKGSFLGVSGKGPFPQLCPEVLQHVHEVSVPLNHISDAPALPKSVPVTELP